MDRSYPNGPPPPTNGRTTGRLLVVEDDDSLRRLLATRLRQAGFEVTACAEGGAALEALEGESFDAVLSDLHMPGIEGLGLLRAVREKDLDLPVVLLTGGPSLETAVEAVEWGALDYLLKPVPSAKLLETMRRAVKLGALARLKRQALVSMGFDRLTGDRAGLEAAFAHAMDGIWMACQPIIRAEDGGLHAHEALVRTREPVFPHPGALFAAAERLGRVTELGAATRREVAGLLASGVFPGKVFVNLHPLDLADDSLLDPAAPLSGFAPRVVLEVTERASLECVADIAERIRRLRRLGFAIAIDDLGAGYAGLTSLAALSPEIVKLDMALVRDLDHDPLKQKLVTSITGVCRELGIQVVAEGVETEAERDAAVAAGCDLLQGFLLGRPAAMVPLIENSK